MCYFTSDVITTLTLLFTSQTISPIQEIKHVLFLLSYKPITSVTE